MDRIEIKASITVDEAGEITGTAWPFGSPDRIGDVIEKGAFTAPARLPMLFAHDQSQAIGVWDSIAENDNGLIVKGRLLVDDVSRAREVRALVREGAVNGLSIGFVTRKAAPRRGGGRTIAALDLHEISIVPIPSHPGARITNIKSEGNSMPENAEVANEIAALDTKIGEVADTVKSLNGLGVRLDKIEARLNRPAPANDNPDADATIERKAFAGFLRSGREALPVEEVKALRIADDTAGGYLAPTPFVAELEKNLVEFSPIRQAARVGATTSGAVILPRRTGTPTAKWVGETETREETGSTYGQAEIPVHEAACFVDVSQRLLEDSATNVEAEVAYDLAEEFGRLEGVAFVSGNGVKRPEGFMSVPSIEATLNGHATNLSADALITMLYSLPALYRGRGAWMMTGSTVATIRKLKDGQGNYLWQPSYQAGQPETILGRPVIEAVDMPEIESGAFPIAYGDWSTAYRIFDRIGLSIVRDPYTQATKGLIRFHARRRVGGAVVRPEAIRKLKMATS